MNAFKLTAPSFNSWTIIFLLIGFQGLIAATAFFVNSRKERSANLFIAFILFFFSLSIISYTLLWTGYIIYFRYMGIVGDITALLFGPLFYLYFFHLSCEKKLNPKQFVHFLPAIILFAYFIPPFFFQTKEQTYEYFHPVYLFLPWIKASHLIIYGLATFFMIRKTNFTSEIGRWAKLMLGFYTGFVLCHVSYYILTNFSFYSFKWDYAIYFSMSAFICFVALLAYIQPKIFNGYAFSELGDVFPSQKYKTSGLSESAADELFISLQNLMATEKLYRENDLRLEKLAMKLNTSRHHLSQVINEKANSNFFEYINNWRINEARELLSNTSKTELNVIEIAYMVGFNNKVSFNNSFKKYTGLTPSEFRTQTSRS